MNCSENKTPKNEAASSYVPDTPQLDSDVMTPEVLWAFGRVGNIDVSPDGKTALFAVTYCNIEENKSYRELYSVPTSGGTAVRLTHNAVNEAAAQWRPDGERIGYLAPTADRGLQLWEMAADGHDVRQISDIDGGITGFKYSPDMTNILYIKPVKLDKNIHDIYPDLPKANARIETDIMYRHWDTWHDYTYNHIFVAPYSAKIIGGTDIMDGQRFDCPNKPMDGLEQIAWNPDSKSIVYSCKKLTGKAYAISTNTDLYRYSLESGRTDNLTDGMSGYDTNPAFSPDGKLMAWLSMERDGYEADQPRIIIMDMASGQKTDFSKQWDYHATAPKWNRDGSKLLFISNIQGTDEICALTPADGKITQLTNGMHDYTSVEEAADGRLIAGKMSMSQPAEIYAVAPESGADTPLTTVTQGIMKQLTMGKVERRTVKTVDNKDMLVWVIYPPHFDPTKKYPALLYCQGGPQSTVSQFWSYRWNMQMMAANGYIVVAPNRRGLPGFGREWLEQISTNYGGLNIQDYMAAIDDVAHEPYVDASRLGAVGASYGGFSVNYLAGCHQGRFKAFISHCGIFNFEQMYVTTEEMWFTNWDMGGAYWEKDKEAVQRSYAASPHLYVDKWDTPILFITGEKDYRIPYTQNMGAFNAAVMRGVPAELLFFPEENHWVTSPQNGILWQRVFREWLDKWLKPEN